MSVSQSNDNSNNMATTTFSYPGCARDSTGPCELQTSSEDACSRLYPGSDDFYVRQVCQCTNGYYNRSSECWIDCYGYDATTTDFLSISLELALASVKCESYSLDMLSESLFYASLNNASASYASESAASAATSSSFAGGAANATTGGSYLFSGTSASQGATATPSAPQATTNWVDRPSSSTQAAAQTGAGVSTKKGGVGRRSALASATVVLVLLSVFCN